MENSIKNNKGITLPKFLKNWNVRRSIYMLVGIFIIVQSVLVSQWFGLIFGGYFTAMGLFGFGCASGNCSVNNVSQNRHRRIN